MRVRFGDCELDKETHQLTRGGDALGITPKAFELLTLLLETRPSALSKADLHDRLWPKIHVARTSLPRLVNEIRSLIGDDATEPRLVRTVYGIGYAFSGDVVDLARAKTRAAFSLVWDDREIALGAGENILGRASDAVLAIPSPKVSRHHARIVITDAGAKLEDLGSKNGTYLNGTRIDGVVPLSDTDEIRIGRAHLVFRTVRASRATQTDSGTRSSRRTKG